MPPGKPDGLAFQRRRRAEIGNGDGKNARRGLGADQPLAAHEIARRDLALDLAVSRLSQSQLFRTDEDRDLAIGFAAIGVEADLCVVDADRGAFPTKDEMKSLRGCS